MEKKIAVVDDDENITTLLEMTLMKKGFAVVKTNSSQQALRLIRQEKPDIVLLDIMMPHIDGFEICRLIKFDETLKHIPVIFLSARTQDKDKEKAKTVGAQDFLNKPYTQDALFEVISKHLKT